MDEDKKKLSDLIHKSANDITVLKGFLKKSRKELEAQNQESALSYIQRSEERLDLLLKYLKEIPR